MSNRHGDLNCNMNIVQLMLALKSKEIFEMSISSSINSFLDKSVDARFKRDAAGNLVFFPWGFGGSRIVPDAATEARLRQGCRRLIIVIFAVLVPLIAIFNSAFQLHGSAFAVYFVGACALGFLSQLYPVWLSRNLPRSTE
ncbi:MAG: hypothetical protein JSS20_10895, partial [Proteobacteria bacterium]|nr:hypothetical protein [Pseudomonadota bacterium]